MSILIKNVQIIDTQSPHHLKKKNIFISEAGIIKNIDNTDHEANKVIESKNLKASIGWFDMWANFNDPGKEHKEDLKSGARAASAGGFTGVALIPNTLPAIESKNEVSYLKSINSFSTTQIYPYGAITKACHGEELTEMIDMNNAGAVAFTDGEYPVWNTDILLKTLLYLRKFDGLLINFAEDKYLTAFGTMNEGTYSTILGMKGMPKLAEEVMVRRDLQLLNYAGGNLHFANISTSESLKQIKKAKNKGLNVSCQVAIYNLFWDESAVADYDTNFKVNPPLREPSDINALLKGIEDGTVDVIVSAHSPQDEESKNLEFDQADFGMLGLQTFYPIINQISEKGDFKEYLPKFTINPRKLLGLPVPVIKEGEKADLTLFDPTKEWVYNEQTNYSKSRNSPLLGKKLKGKVLGVVNNGRSFFDDKK